MGLLGRTGSGKTTLARLLFRFYDPDSGSIALSHDGTRSTCAHCRLKPCGSG
jgi:ATP-binding cassette, subfamily B, bacterial